MIRTDRRLRICRVLLVLNLCFIWGNSLLPGELSGAFSDWVKGILALLLPGDGLESSSGGLLRKAAHFTEFAALGGLLAWRFAMMEKPVPGALFWGAMAACVDETIQRFVPDRGPSLMDVGIDTCGVLTGILLLHLGHFLIRRIQSKHDGGNT